MHEIHRCIIGAGEFYEFANSLARLLCETCVCACVFESLSAIRNQMGLRIELHTLPIAYPRHLALFPVYYSALAHAYSLETWCVGFLQVYPRFGFVRLCFNVHSFRDFSLLSFPLKSCFIWKFPPDSRGQRKL